MSDTFGVLVNFSPYQGLDEGVAWIQALKERAEKESAEQEGLKYFLALPFDVLQTAASAPAPRFVVLGAQNMNAVKTGSFTELVAGRLLSSVGAGFVLLGSRRTRKEGESNETIRDKLKKALEAGLTPVLCIGETAEERAGEQTAEVLTRQVGEATLGMEAAELSGLQVVYEAPWIEEAVSRPESQEIDNAYQFCRDLVHSLFGEPLASSVRIYCPVPSDLKEVESFMHTLQADGFFFNDPHQLTAIDEAALRAKASTARKVREAEETFDAVADPVQQETDFLKKAPSERETMAEEAAQLEEQQEERAPESKNEQTAQREDNAVPESLNEKTGQLEEQAAPESKNEEEAAPLKEQAEEGKPDKAEEKTQLEEQAEDAALEPIEAAGDVSEAAENEEFKLEEKPRDVSVSNISATVAEAKKRRKKKISE